MTVKTEVVVVGGGVIGCSVARELAKEGRNVVVLERGEPCREASWAAAGALIARALGPDEGPLVRFKIQSLNLFEDHCACLCDETGIDSGFRKTGGLDFLIEPEEKKQIEDYLAWQRMVGVEAEAVDAKELHRMEPKLTTEIESAVYFPTFTQVRTPWYGRALISAAMTYGVRIEPHTEVRQFLLKGSRVVGVRTDWEEYHADLTILAAGAWSTPLAQLLGKPLPGTPVKGQILLLFDRRNPVRHIVHHGKTYITPREDGRMVVGSTEEWVGFSRENTAAGVALLLNRAQGFYPCLGEAQVEKTWYGFRPLTADGLPYIGGIDGLEGFMAATGHYRSGIILAPITGRVVADLVSGRKPIFDVTPFSPNRVSQLSEDSLKPRTDLH